MHEPDTDEYIEEKELRNVEDESEMTSISFARLRKDSYIKAILSDLRAGLQNTLQVFIINAANVFLLEISPEKDLLLDEQVDMCKRVLNIYRFMVMNVQMEKKTWEQLLLVLLQITSLVLKERPPIRKDSLGGRLAPALFQTLIVTWIKANLNVIISSDLWDQFLSVLSSLTQWEELIKEWAKTMETLTRVLARHVYNLDLNDLPLQRLSEQKQKKRRGIKNVPTSASGKRSTFNKLESSKASNNVVTKKEEKLTTPLPSTALDDASSSDIQENFSSSGVTRTRSGSGDIRKCSTSPSDRTTISRSASDSHLAYRKKKRHYSSHDSSSASQNQLRTYFVPSITGIPAGMEDEVFRILASAEDYIQEHCSPKGIYHCTKSKSLDYLSQRAESPCLSESSEFRSRSPSPTPSSGLENTSIKDSPMQIEVMVNSSENSCNTSGLSEKRKKEVGNILEPKSVMAGGTGRGWLPDVAVVLWRRMLGALGDINKIIDPVIHAQVMEYLVELSDLLIKIRNNLGVTVDNQSSPPPSEFVPPLHIITSWLFQAINLPDEYHQGKILAYKLLCILTLQRQDIPFSRDYLIQFYKTLHYGLVGTNQEIINTIVKYCGPKIFAVGLPGCTLLLLDLIFAANTIASSNEVKGVPRTEALSILGSLLCFPNAFGDMPVLQPSPTDLVCMNCTDVKEHVISILLRSGKREPAGLARCIAISSLGIFIYEELLHKTSHPRIKEAINILLTAIRLPVTNGFRKGLNKSLKFNNKSVAQVSSDMLLLLTDHADYFVKQYPDIPPKIIEIIASTLASLLPCLENSPSDDDKKLLLSLIFCLGEWCLHLPQNILTQLGKNNNSLLLSVFKVLNTAVSGKSDIQKAAPITSMTDLVGPDVDPNIHYDNLKEHVGIANSPKLSSANNMEKSSMESFIKTCTLPMDMKRNSNIIKLAAKVVMSHLVNHLGHFPMGVGAARLTSLVNEADDVPLLTRDELSTEVFHAPNIQFFVLNSSIISFVEIPCVEVPGGGPTSDLITGRSQVRIIVRDLSGKFSWDCSVLYGPPDCQAASVLPDQSVSISVNNFLNPRAGLPYHSLSSSSLSLTGMSASPSCDTLRHRSPHELPTVENSADDLDNLDDLLQYIDHSSPECVLRPGQPLNTPAPLFGEGTTEKEVDTMTVVLNQRNFEMTHNQKHSIDSSTMAKPAIPPGQCKNISPFQHCRLLLEQLGFISWEKRPHFDLLKKNEKLLRELRNLDNQKCRETHKIAVIYVAEGQEDKNSLLLNSGGSQAFEEFVAGLGWEVDLETHTGFMGGLQRNKSTGDSAPYYATSFLEVIFHVSTRMPTSMDETLITRKLCHLGNDEVHIVWSEHTRDYRRGIIATEFCDVLIVIYPLPNQLYRIQISRKPEIPYFGPLFNGAIIDQKVLSGLVRATAINASRAKRALIPLYQNFYEERSRSLETIVQNHKDPTTFEQFASCVYCPAPIKMHLRNREMDNSIHGADYFAHGTSNLAAALLDSHGKSSSYSPNIRNRPMSLSSERPLSGSHSDSSPTFPSDKVTH
ncbi:ral GTPase-activating protein subunit alpha-1-like isoform X3 [Centruroides sculpturatus]|uniref:ral GTPase-activating protein subunit alpha-1-like isoform X3 n=1 Tax=Centruroides sculpturatus TaxID=218467 RepID=UPI000C6E9182|nr:ral GTPase-activating protein subunit alpha-1-like isoform X3 [Centruroides sculpturatus]